MIDNECAVEVQQSFKQRKPLAEEFSFVLFSERNGIGARSRDRPREKKAKKMAKLNGFSRHCQKQIVVAASLKCQ